MTLTQQVVLAISMHYGVGFVWIVICISAGHFRLSHGASPMLAAFWVIVMSALWPVIVYRLLRGIARGEKYIKL